MSGYSTITRSLGLAALCAALLTACGASTDQTSSPAVDNTATSVATQAAASTAPSPTAEPTSTPTVAPTSAPTAEATASATMAAMAGMDHSQHMAGSGAETKAEIKLFMFKPATLELKAGTTVVWTNQDAIDHSVTAGRPGAPSGAFDSDFFNQGQTYTFTFTEPGTYDYFCKRHESMVGTITVTAP